MLVALSAIFHQLILQTLGRRAAIRFAAKKNLRLDFRLEGSVLGGLVLRNVHAVAIGPTALQSADIDLVRVDYSLWNWITKGKMDVLQNVEVRNAAIVLDPTMTPLEIKLPKGDEKFALRTFFPRRFVLTDFNLRYVSPPQDLVIEHLSLELNPRDAGGLRVARLQLASGWAWNNIVATTTYENRDLILRDLVLDEQTKLRLVNVDASRLASSALDVKVEGEVLGGKISAAVSLSKKTDGMGAGIDFAAEDLSLETLTRYLNPPTIQGAIIRGPRIKLDTPKAAMRGDAKRIAIKMQGIIERPSSWNGSIAGQLENIAAGGVVFGSAAIDLRASDGTVTINAFDLKQGPSTITTRGTVTLPDTLDGLGRSPATIELRGLAPDLAAMTAGMTQPIKGVGEFSGRISVKDETMIADFNVAAGPIDFGTGAVQRAIVKLRATKKLAPPRVERPYFEGLNSEIGLDVTDVLANGYAIDSVTGKIRTDGQRVTIEQLLVNRRENRLTVSGQYLLPMDFSLAASQPAAFNVSLVAPNVGDYWASEDAADRITGSLQFSAQADYRKGLGDGSFSVYGSNLRVRKMVVRELSGTGATSANVVYLNDLTARLNEHDSIRAHGTAEVEAPYNYTGTLALNVVDMSAFESILRAAGNEKKLAGVLAIDWEGSGAISTFKNAGNLKLTLEKGRFAGLEKLEAKIDANYSPDELNVPIVYFSSDKMMFQATMRTKDRALEISKIQIDQGQAQYASGYISVPFVWANVGTDKPLFANDGKVLVTFQTGNLDIQQLAKDVGTTASISGLANVKLEAGGTLDNLRATFGLQLAGLRSGDWKELKPALFNLSARLENKELLVDGKFEQERIEPVQISANLPFDLAKILEKRQFDGQTPIKANVRMARSSVNFARQFVPALERIDGDLTLDVNFGGTIDKPSLSGVADMTINAARFSNPTLPAVTKFNARVAFTEDRVDFNQFRGELAGGPFTLSGRVTFPKLTKPNLDLQLRADAVLVARNDNLTARADADIRITGPLAGATVTGNIALTNSEFLKNIELIPIGLPGRPPSAPKPPMDIPDLSFPKPPLRDWKFDVAIKTKDPIRIRGNLANGGAVVDMRLTGTGLKPLINGSVRLQKVEATLPFSRMEITQGSLYFNPEEPFNPGIDLQGTSFVRDYTVRVYVHGTANSPEAVFTSEPTLPQEEIISLLATGTTREELASGSNVLAGRALMLLGQQIYQKIFRKGQPAGSNSIFDRLQVDVGNVDPRTGRQTAIARYRATDQVQLIGELGVQGDFQGRVKYVIRFR